ncbi:MAG: aspartyl-tRNA(Asn)/glutamyl-tRNA(Gln) amidotransferase subunit [Moorella sp. (in: firmicutes)]|jgi:aspartyl-tRNA(Asn)/glutamyl-tRNA(Gln) amidotransferase subunit A|uniref:Asp-tRNA(Asn)/Glu-tRNA(Gln) amidotransferase subunit GatA n=1 Tax=unclassified Neomoorella TaxID=2676739 RepID=UPI0010FFB2B9|nr:MULTISPECIES: Asp-tRNA(Asn)/Glu-tRNA(Gln) amidotransferase subunit GatA [unclassified Moorella (in: firmicutes)]MDK2815944.1 aspartyl-tRNA(Asn)/glutamyl-tRNA(Gln) amidotransferase subunit [Moorella sp. (in: firmicutes)]GEA13952.1 glutamyl-tRNA(Gln) amidotransferase subunit A [Moorella sp. E308F]GEA18675.1 glutamyl-tRNA(Gln) amidotransferase subunit A [Moorella sp. E306M]
MDLHYLTVHELGDLLQRREVSAVEVTEAMLERIEAVDGRVQAYLTRTAEEALEQAKAVDAARARGEDPGILAGVPMALKDNLCTEGVRTTCASRMLAEWVPPYDATVVRRLKTAGAVILGKLNMDEFAMGSSTENSGFFPTRNPWDLERVPGGSSGGSVAAVAAGEACYALGSDTGGSIRQPASFCGVVGMKPTYGRVSRYGLVAFASSLDQIGPITRDVTDCALVLGVIAGHDPSDSTSADLPVPDYRAALQPEIKGLKIGVPREYFGAGIEPEVEKVVRRAIAKLEEMGAICEETSLPHTEYALPAYYLVAPAEASSNLARYDGVSYGLRVPGKDIIEMYMNTRSQGFGPEVKRRIMLGTYALSSGYYDAYYLKALKVRTLIRRDFEAAFSKYDLLATPTSPTVAFRLGEKAGDPLAMYMSDLCTIPVNMAGLPALSIPCGFSQGLPVGLQLIGKAFDEATLLRVAYAFEQATEYHRRRPELGVA